MFNQQLFTQHLKEVKTGNITPTEFVMLCWMNNDVQLNDSDVIERHTIYFAERVNVSERQAQRLFNSLSDKGFINIVRRGTKRNRKPNVFRLYNDMDVAKKTDENDVYNDIYNDMNVTPRKTCKTTCIHKVSRRTSTGTREKNNSDNETEKKMETELKQERTHTRKEDNDYVTRCLEKFDTMLKYLYSITDMRIYDEYTNDILDFYNSIDQTRFTEKQRGLIEKKCETWVKISDGKNCYFNGKSEKTDNNDESISMEPEQQTTADNTYSYEDQSEADRLTYPQSSIDEKRPSPAKETRKCGKVYKEQAKEWLDRILPQYENYDSFTSAMQKKFNETYGDWDYGKDKNACDLWNFSQRYASNYYSDLAAANAKKEKELDAAFDEFIKEVSNDEAPWEESKATKPELNDEEWHEKYGHLLKH